MIALLSESRRYIKYVEQELGIIFKYIEEKTPVGKIGLAVNGDILFFENVGINPTAVGYLLEKYKVRYMAMVSKVGGINRLLQVGDILVIDDYIDNTTNRDKSYINLTREKIKIRYSMAVPFCSMWKERFCEEYYREYNGNNVNFFENSVYVCTDGPGFESTAEINIFRQFGADVVGHSVSPFVYYARELNICFVAIGIVSNVYDKEHVKQWDEEANNLVFARLYHLLIKSKPNYPCDCQRKYILQCEEY